MSSLQENDYKAKGLPYNQQNLNQSKANILSISQIGGKGTFFNQNGKNVSSHPHPLIAMSNYYMIQMVTIEQLTRGQPSSVHSLDLRSSKTQKIHRIDSLSRFTQLRELNLANNMITRIQNLTHLPLLRVLNLEFNQISKLEGLRGLVRLQEAFLSYNCIESISGQLRENQGLRVIHLAYNDLKSIQDIRPLCNLPALSVLSLIGNPFLAALNYIAFIKMLIPSLVLLDDRDAGQCLIAANVYPHEEIFILRDALNKLLDERNHAERAGDRDRDRDRDMGRDRDRDREEGERTVLGSGFKDGSPAGKDQTGGRSQDLLGLLQQWRATYERRAQSKRLQINDLSESYSQCMRKGRTGRPEGELQVKIEKYRLQEEKGQISEEGRGRLAKLLREAERNQQQINQQREQSRNLLQLLKSKEGEYGRLRQKAQVLRVLCDKLTQPNDESAEQALLSHLLYGTTGKDINYRHLKNYLCDGKGMLFYMQTLTSIIFGEQADGQRIMRLKEFLGEKSLIEVIANLKQMGLKHKKERKRFQKERSKMIEQFQSQAQELCEQWRELQRQKSALKHSKHGYDTTQTPGKRYESIASIQERFSLVEGEQRRRIMMLKKEKQHYQDRVSALQEKYESLQAQFARKYKQLEEFQRFFEEFKNQREIVNGLKEEIQGTTKELTSKQTLLSQLQSSVKQLSIKESTLLQKSAQYERRVFQRAQELKLLQEKIRTSQEKLRRVGEQFNLKSYECLTAQQQLTRFAEQLRETQKKMERQRHTLDLYEEKLRNLSQLQSNKRTSLAQMESEVQAERRELTQVLRRVAQAEQKQNRLIQSTYQYQLKIQQNKKTLQSLTDINKTVSDMMERQAQLKRSVFQLQLETQHLQEVKARIMKDIKLQYDDQDQNL